VTARKRKQKTAGTTPRRLGEWKNKYDAALEALRGNGQDFVTWRNADTGETKLIPAPLPGAHEDLERALDNMLGGTGQCVMTERPADHVPLYARVSSDGSVVASCTCSGCEAARKCKCPACRAVRRFARSGEADRSGEKPASENTASEEIAEATYDLLRDQLTLQRPSWKKLADWLEDVRDAEHEQVTLPGKPGFVRIFKRVVNLESLRTWRKKLGDRATPDANRLRMLCERRIGRR
jgi:hypothetical protein